MDGAVVGAVLGATIQVLLQNVLSSILEIKPASVYEEDLARISSYVDMIGKYLAYAEARRFGDGPVQEWLNRLEDVAFEADDVLDVVKYQLLRRQVKKQNGASNKVLGLLPSAPSKWIFKRKMAVKIKNVIHKMENINKDATDLGLHNEVAVSTTPERETDSFSVEPNVVGRENDVSDIVKKLIAAPPHEKISVIPIVGMGGIGKTTLAREVFHDEEIEKHFAVKIWVFSFQFKSALLFNKILETLTIEKAATKQGALQKIEKCLKGKNYFLVLDDVWEENCGIWEDFMIPLSKISDVNGNCIVVTTRSEDVGQVVRQLPVGKFPTHRLLGLSKTQCWSIIKNQTYSGVDVPEEFESIGERIAERCGGVPLAAKAVGAFLHGKCKQEWLNILENKLSYWGKDDTIKKILKLSYDNLPSLPIKKCFAYCSIFPQHFKIERRHLIELWMAEGFLQADEVNDMETVGNNFFNHLLRYSLFQGAERDFFGDIVHCKMHQLFHEVAYDITNNTLKRVRYRAIESTTILPGPMKYLRTLFFNGTTAKDVFSNFKCLHVLKLTGKINELPPVIEKLIHLRCLDISETEIVCLPDSIGKLYHLQTLWVAPDLKKLPNTIIDLVRLRHMHISDSTELPPGIGKLTNLRTLSYYNVRNENGCGIRELRNLKNLKGVLEIVNLQRVNDKEEAELADLYSKPGISKLVLGWNEPRDGERNDENILDGLQPHEHLKSLEITGYEGKNFPSWTRRMVIHNGEALNNLLQIKLTKCTRCKELPTLGRLPCLKILELSDLCKVRSIDQSFYGCVNLAEAKPAFPALEMLKLLNMPELTEWVNMKGGVTVFPCLKEMEISYCPKLKSLQNRFPRLNYLRIRGCTKLNSVQIRFPCLVHLSISDCPKLKGLQSRFTRLNYLEIKNCPKLTSLQSRFPCLKEISRN